MIFAEKYRILLHHIFQLRPRAPDSALRERQDPRLGAGFDARARDHRAPRACAGRSGLSADAWEFDGFACAAAQRKLVVGARGLAVVVARSGRASLMLNTIQHNLMLKSILRPLPSVIEL